jgi:predicted nucleic acid-binding protein
LKVIVDTCVWSLSLRRRDETRMNAQEQQMVARLSDAIKDRLATIIGPVRQEILSGIRDQVQFSKTEALLDPFLDEEVATADYVNAARLFNACRSRGVECGATDILICAVAGRRQWDILTYDQGMIRCMELLRSEGLMP